MWWMLINHCLLLLTLFVALYNVFSTWLGNKQMFDYVLFILINIYFDIHFPLSIPHPTLSVYAGTPSTNMKCLCAIWLDEYSFDLNFSSDNHFFVTNKNANS